jgi:hypothetical protein
MKQAPKKPVTAVAAERLNESLSAAKKQLNQVEKDVVSEAKKQRRSLEKLLARVRSRQDLKVLEKRIATTATELQTRVKTMPREVLGVLGVATSDDVQKLTRNLSRLTKRVDELAKRQSIA